MHRIRSLAVSLGIAALVTIPQLASAVTAAELQAQIAELVAKITALQQQIGAPATTVPTVGAGGTCPSLSRTLSYASEGEDVSSVQRYLAQDPAIYPEALVTGYYGSLTQLAVQRFQTKHGIVLSGSAETTGYGVVGPRTAAKIRELCSGGIPAGLSAVAGGYITVTPTAGPAPLAVSVAATVNTVQSCAGAIYLLSWGDNTQPQTISVPAGQCGQMVQALAHTYAVPGAYTIKLATGAHETTVDITVTGIGGAQTQAQTNPATSIQMVANAFTPKSLTVKSGTMVKWTNADTVSHTVTADNGSYNSGTIQPGQSYSLTFTIPGTYTYYCTLHSGMTGTIIVQ